MQTHFINHISIAGKTRSLLPQDSLIQQNIKSVGHKGKGKAIIEVLRNPFA